jgi:hypothetical protein
MPNPKFKRLDIISSCRMCPHRELVLGDFICDLTASVISNVLRGFPDDCPLEDYEEVENA